MKKNVSGFMAWLVTMSLALFAIAAGDAPVKPENSWGLRQTKSPESEVHVPSVAAQPSPNSIVYRPQKATLPAAHRIHADKTKLTCLDCHQNARASRAAGDWLGPTHQQCVQCHAQRFEDSTPPRLESARIRFSHAKHAARNIGCTICHGRVKERDDAVGNEQLPLMSRCLVCHSGPTGSRQSAGSDCRLCHLSRGGVIQTRFREGRLLPSNSLGPMEHTGDWKTRHGDAAMNQGRLCLTCHQEQECVACHNGRLRPRSIHPSDWLRLHGIASRQEGPACGTCHRDQSECLTCHLRVGLSPAGPRAAAGARGRFHPPASIWTDRPRTGQHHAVQARLHLDECVSCHQERDCTSCHATAGVGGPGIGAPSGMSLSPHPPGFRLLCGGTLGKNPRACLVCHRADDVELLPCR